MLQKRKHGLSTIKIKIAQALFTAMIPMTVMGIGALKVCASDNLKSATQCTFMVPPEMDATTKKGLFEHLNFPMESCTISYSVYDNGEDKVLTNREKKAIEESGDKVVLYDPENLTKEIYQETISAAYNKEYGQNVGCHVESFEKIDIDGYPGYKISLTYKNADEEKIYQTAFIIVSKYKVFTVTYQRAEDDDCQEMFDISQASIHVK
ncbi:hypothetical protein [Butyrivibrio sp. YAB3001]|uniref:hypothetical protein n=1 Tax=Butyrivibrio sp. YAB3001 TaxID=1520812 RepID=UPI0008F677F9|nr:hypothetical protein [Butyrivibrio sp. YAB3001]SFB84398.1 hypothetical protein SAMN02910398_00842 [Butyrivibrio sp. YAB3001]